MSAGTPVPCPACSAVTPSYTLQVHVDPVTKEEYTLHRCAECEVEFWTPLVMPPASYYEDAGGDYSVFHETGSDVIRWWHRSFMEKFPGIRQRGKILDIGCADGRFLRKMKELGWDIYGLDLDRRSVEVAKRNCSTGNIYHCFLEEFVTPEREHTFDVITFFEVLEHQPDPQKFMSLVKRLLKRGGKIAGSVPNTDRYIVDIRYSPDNPPHHFTLWREANLERFMARQGFEGMHSAHTRFEPLLLDQIVRKLTRRKIESMKLELGVRSFETMPERDKASAASRRLASLKRFVWNPVMAVLSPVEYPILWITGKSVSLYFDATLSGTSS